MAINLGFTSSSVTRNQCPLCGSGQTTVSEVVRATEIQQEFKRQLGIDIELASELIYYAVCGNCHLGFFDPMVCGDDSLYKSLQRYEWYYMADKREYYVAQQYLPSQGPVLEVGSGMGLFSRIVGTHRYVGLELNKAAVDRAAQDGISLLQQTIEQHSKEHAGRYPAVVSFQVIEHVADPASFIGGCVDALQSRGRLILAMPNHEGICGMAQNSVLDLPPHHLSHWSQQTLRFIDQSFGVRLIAIETEPVADYHKQWAMKSVYEHRLRTLFGLKKKLIDTTTTARAIGKLASAFAYFRPCSVSNLGGHTILACFEKY